MRPRRLVPLLALAVLIGPARPAMAAEDGGTLSPFASGAGCRALALGGAFVAIAEDATALTWNPAGLGRVTRSGFEATHTEHTSVGASDEYAALVMPSWRWGTAAVSIRHLGVGGIERRDERNVVLDGEISDSETEITLGYARALNEAWSAGAAIKMQRQSLGGFSAGGVGADLGVLVSLSSALGGANWLKGITWGLAGRNLLEPSLRLDRESVSDPRLWRTGLAWRGASGIIPDMRLALDVDRADGASARLHAGAEVRVHPLLVLRGGLDRGRAAVGAGVSWREIDISYAYQDGDVTPVHRVGIARPFGPTVAARREAARRANEEALQTRLEDEFQQRRGRQLDQLLARAEAALSQGSFDSALEILAGASMLDSTDVRVHSLEARCQREMATSLERAGDFAAAAMAYERALAIAPGDTVAQNGERRAREAYERRAARDASRRGRFETALSAFASGDLGGARSGFAALVATDRADSQSVAMLRRVDQAIANSVASLIRQARQSLEAQAYDEAARALARARALDPRAPGLAELEASLGDARKVMPPAQAPPTIARTVASAESRREADEMFRRGVAAMSAGRPDDALRFWELALSLDPENTGAGRALNREYLVRGMDAYAAGRLEDAMSYWEKARRADPSDRRAAGFLARARERELRTRELSGQGR
jgi:tetratricopeptide (TPR) repeat protein